MSKEKQQNRALILLYGLLFVASCLMHQFFRLPAVRIPLVLVTLGILFFWRYLNKRNILTLSFFSSLFQGNLRKNERRFLYALPLLLMPLLRFHALTARDLILSLLFVAVVLLLNVLDQKQFFKQHWCFLLFCHQTAKRQLTHSWAKLSFLVCSSQSMT